MNESHPVRLAAVVSGPSITSQQIAELVESRHDSVKRTVERLVAAGVIVQPPTVDEPGADAMGRSRPTQVYVFAGERGKRDSIVVVAQLSPQFTARLVDRWMALEAGAAPRAPRTLTEALRLALEQAEQIEALQHTVAEQTPKVEALERLASTKATYSIRDACGPLGMRETDLRAYLVEKGWLYRDRPSGDWRGSSEARHWGLLTHKVRPFEKANGERDSRLQVRITAAGLAKLGEMRARAAQGSASARAAIERCGRALS